jgi:hypothetical protein
VTAHFRANSISITRQNPPTAKLDPENIGIAFCLRLGGIFSKAEPPLPVPEIKPRM